MEKVVIVGGGLGGLLLALLLERASVDYVVLERSDVAKMPIEGGGVITITSQIQPLLKQLGLLDALQHAAKPLTCVSIVAAVQGSRRLPNVVGIIDSAFSLARYGYYSLVIPRPELYNYLVSQVPPEKLLLGKQVQDVMQDDRVATCICTDGSSFQGIIVGADGAYSSVRLSLYRQLKDKGLLPAPDQRPLQYQYRALALPYGGQPFVQAALDAVILANTLYAHSQDPSRDIRAGLRSYEAERRVNAKVAYNGTFRFWRLISWQGRIGTLVRYLVLNCVPQFLQHWLGDRLNRSRPQAKFLPMVV
ncbi:hypothetical protein BGX31_005142 [Mortierella sp. GBA43]|nr:hypothetical protein BGX31_005142 [Mortierella sp. GBA43]